MYSKIMAVQEPRKTAWCHGQTRRCVGHGSHAADTALFIRPRPSFFYYLLFKFSIQRVLSSALFPLFLLLHGCVISNNPRGVNDENLQTSNLQTKAGCPVIHGTYKNETDAISIRPFARTLSIYFGASNAIDYETDKKGAWVDTVSILPLNDSSWKIDVYAKNGKSKSLVFNVGDRGTVCQDGALVFPRSSDNKAEGLGGYASTYQFSLMAPATKDGYLIGKEISYSAGLGLWIIPIMARATTWFAWAPSTKYPPPEQNPE